MWVKINPCHKTFLERTFFVFLVMPIVCVLITGERVYNAT